MCIGSVVQKLLQVRQLLMQKMMVIAFFVFLINMKFCFTKLLIHCSIPSLKGQNMEIYCTKPHLLKFEVIT